MLRRTIVGVPQLGRRFASYLTNMNNIRSNFPSSFGLIQQQQQGQQVNNRLMNENFVIKMSYMNQNVNSVILDEVNKIEDMKDIEIDNSDITTDSKSFQLTSVLRKRRLKMKKHKLKKRRKAQRALKIRIGK